MNSSNGNIFTRLWRRLFAYTDGESSGATTPAEWFVRWVRGGDDDNPTGITVTTESALKSSAVWACIRLRANAISTLPLILYRSLGDGNKERARNHPQWSLFHTEPNREQDIQEYLSFGQASIDLWGNAYSINKTNGRGETAALESLHPSAVKPKRLDSGQVIYEYKDGIKSRTFDRDSLFHVPSMAIGSDMITGLSPVAYHRNAIGLTLAAEEFGGSFFGNGAVPSGFIEYEGTMTPEQKKAAGESFNRKGKRQAAKIGILDQKRKFTAISMPMEDAQFLETRKFQVSDIARIWECPSPLINDNERSTFSNVEQLSLNFRIYTMRPMYRRWEAAFNRQCLTAAQKASLFVEFLIEELLTADLNAKGVYLRTLFGMGMLSPNEGRGYLNLNPIEGGDRYFLPMNMVPADKVDEMLEKSKSGGSPPDTTGSGAPREAVENMVRDRVERMVRVECEQLIEASKREGNFLNWMDLFYQKQEDRMYQALRSIVPVALFHQGREPNGLESERMAREHCERSKRYVLAVCDVSKASNFTDNITTAVTTWPQTRTDEILRDIFREELIHAA